MRCKHCKTKFEPKYFNQKYCMGTDECISAFVAYSKKKAAKTKNKEWNAEKKKIKESLLTHKDYLKMLQTVFNAYIRKRDANKPCITCLKPLKGKFDAGHLYSVGAYPSLRFDEDNVHGQCVFCNQHQHGSISEYTINLPKRIGQERFEALQAKRKDTLKLSIPEIKELITYYKSKIKEL